MLPFRLVRKCSYNCFPNLECCSLLKVSSLKDRLEKIAGTQAQMKDEITHLTDQLKDLRAFEIKLNDIEQQHQKLAKQQEACQQTIEAHDKSLSNLTTSQITTQKTVDELKNKQSETDNALQDLRTKQETSRIPTDEGTWLCIKFSVYIPG